MEDKIIGGDSEHTANMQKNSWGCIMKKTPCGRLIYCTKAHNEEVNLQTETNTSKNE